MTQAKLFVRGDESIRLIRFPAGRTVQTFGPIHARQVYEFDSEISLEEFWQSFEARLLGDGWIVHRVADRRH